RRGPPWRPRGACPDSSSWRRPIPSPSSTTWRRATARRIWCRWCWRCSGARGRGAALEDKQRTGGPRRIGALRGPSPEPWATSPDPADEELRMRIATWNVNSLKARLEKVTWWLGRTRPDVLLMQETKLADGDVPVEAFEAAGYEVAHHGEGRWNGVAIASRVG